MVSSLRTPGYRAQQEAVAAAELQRGHEATDQGAHKLVECIVAL